MAEPDARPSRSSGTRPGVEVSTGPLGQGFANAVGFALAEAHLAATLQPARRTRSSTTTRSRSAATATWRRASPARRPRWPGYLGLGKLIAIYDDNKITIEGPTDLAYHDDVGKRFDAYGWSRSRARRSTSPLERIVAALEEAKSITDRPSMIVLRIAHRLRQPEQAGHASAHGAPLGAEEVALTKKALGWPYEEPFTVPEEVYELFAGVSGARHRRRGRVGRALRGLRGRALRPRRRVRCASPAAALPRAGRRSPPPRSSRPAATRWRRARRPARR